MSPDADPLLVPSLRAGEETTDTDTLDAWHLALSNAVSPDLPHDLLAVWLYPAAGGAELIAPAALAADQLTVPVPPDIPAHQLALLEEIVQDAGYPSVAVAVIRSGDRETGLVLFAALREDVYGDRERRLIAGVAEGLSAMFGRLARLWGRPVPLDGQDRGAAAISAVATAVATAGSSRELSSGLLASLAPWIAADRLELLVPGSSAEEWYRFGEHRGGPLGSDPDLVLTRHALDVTALFGAGDSVLRGDVTAGGRPIFPRHETAGLIRSVVGVWLEVGGRTVGALLLGAREAHRFTDADATQLATIAPLVAMRVDASIAAAHLQVMRSHLAALRSVPAQLGRLADMLASTADPADATSRFAVEARAVLVFERMHFALGLNQDDRVAIMAPGETRALPDLPLTPIAGTGLGRVVRGDVPNLTMRAEGRADLIVALRVAGRVIGAMVLTGGEATMFGRGDIEVAQQLADLVAPHLELLRRTAIAPPPILPGWKRAPKF